MMTEDMAEARERAKRIRRFLTALFLFACICVLYYYERRMNPQNTTAYVLNYRYGLIPRGLIGSLIDLFCHITGLDMYYYHGAILISWCATVLYFLLLFGVYALLLYRCPAAAMRRMELVICFFSVFAFPEFVTWNNFGRLDEYLMIVTLLCMLLLVSGRAEWLLIPLCLVAGLIHIGFVFTNSGIILIPLLCKAIDVKDRRRRRYYVLILLGCIAVLAVLFIYLEWIRKPVGMEAYQSFVAAARKIAEDPNNIKDAYSLLDSELLKKDVFADEWVWHTKNYVETPIFVILFLPYIISWVRFLADLCRGCTGKWIRLKYFVIAAGAVTILPELLLKVDYGRWVFSIIAYYSFVIMMLLSWGDSHLTKTLVRRMGAVHGRLGILWPVVFLYPMIFMPLRDVYITDITTNLMNRFAPLIGLW